MTREDFKGLNMTFISISFTFDTTDISFSNLTTNINPTMCGADCIGILNEKYTVETIMPTPWPTVFSGPFGRLIILCFFLSSVSFIAMMAYIGMYVNLLLSHHGILCVPYSFTRLSIGTPIVLVLWFLNTLYIMRFCHRTRTTPMHHRVAWCGIIFLSYMGVFLGLQIYAPLFSIEGLIIKEENGTDLMFQLLNHQEENSAGCPDVYPILFQASGLENMFPNSSCDFVPFYNLCPVFGPLRSTNFSGAFRCRQNAGHDLGSSMAYLESLSGFGCTATSLGAIFSVFFQFGYLLLMERRLLPPNEWVEKQCCQSSFGMLTERTRLI